MSYQAPVVVTPPQTSETPSNELCENPAGYEYTCYNFDECKQYLNGYAAVVKERFVAQKDGWFIEDGDTQRVDINLYYEFEGIYMIGYIEATRHGKRVWMDVSTWVCDLELNLVEPPGTLGGWAEWEL
jgi:hypothetical protein